MVLLSTILLSDTVVAYLLEALRAVIVTLLSVVIADAIVKEIIHTRRMPAVVNLVVVDFVGSLQPIIAIALILLLLALVQA